MSTVVDVGALGSRGFIIQGDNDRDEAGFSLSPAGDINGDGLDDFIIGAPFNDSGGTDSGAAYVIFGRAGGFGPIDLGHLQAADGFMIQGDRALDHAGISVSGGGDVNGDGFGDLLVGTSGSGQFGDDNNHNVYVIFGRPGGFATIDLTDLAPPTGVLVRGITGSNVFGSVAAAGDVNGDGFGDIVIGSPASSSAYIVFGKAGFGALDLSNLGTGGFVIANDQDFTVGRVVAGAGDVNGDGFDDVIVTSTATGFYGYGSQSHAYVIFGKPGGFAPIDLSHLASSDGFRIESTYTYNSNGLSVAGAGDVNGDGFADIVIGSPVDNEAFVIFGKAGGFDPINIGAFPPAAGFVIRGATANDWAGAAVSAAGDVNGDGFADILVGASLADSGGPDSGNAYVIFGKAGGFAAVIDLANLAPADGFVIQGNVIGSHTGSSVARLGDINGDGGDDVIVGAPLRDHIGVAGEAYVLFGTPVLHPHDPATDFNGDGRSDILWRNDNGQIGDWLGGANGGFGPGWGTAVSLDWKVVGTGDFNGDGRDDILWRNDNGQVSDWLGAANGGFTAAWGTTIAASWKVAATGDFDGDGNDDILWRNDNGQIADWLGAGNGSFTSRWGTAVSLDWKVSGSGDFNGDGRDDLLWRNDNGLMSVWVAAANGGFSPGWGASAPVDWQIAGTGDFNGDGRDDILWRNDNGQLTDWLTNANGSFATGAGGTNVPLDWKIAAIGDFNGDGRDDLLWRNDNGQLSDWLGQANGGWVDNAASASTSVATSWHVQDPFL
jgi:hypothetical protein